MEHFSAENSAQLKAVVMPLTTHSARITGPLPYPKGNGRKANIPIGPCIVEQVENDQLIDIIWGTRGQSSVALRATDVKAAVDAGALVLLD
jgi:hypothetical protein